MHIHATAHVCKSEDNAQELLLSINHVRVEEGTQVLVKEFYPNREKAAKIYRMNLSGPHQRVSIQNAFIKRDA